MNLCPLHKALEMVTPCCTHQHVLLPSPTTDAPSPSLGSHRQSLFASLMVATSLRKGSQKLSCLCHAQSCSWVPALLFELDTGV